MQRTDLLLGLGKMTQNRLFAIGSATLLSLIQIIGVSEVVRSAPDPSAASSKRLSLCF
jgi:hypothetical protein